MTVTENPIDNDEKLRGLLAGISDVTSKASYDQWLKAFLKRYTKHLDPNGILNGRDGNYRLLKQLEELANRIALVQGPLGDGSLNTPNGRRLLTNLGDQLQKTETKVQEFLPKTSADEERYGFDKFELAAVLLQDGFHSYDQLCEARAVIEAISEWLNDNQVDHVGDFQTLAHRYSDSVESFVQVLEDLKLFRVMRQCIDVVYQGVKRPKPKPPPPPEAADALPGDSLSSHDGDHDKENAKSSSGRSNKSGSPKTGKSGKSKKKPRSKTSSRNLASKPASKKKKSKDVTGFSSPFGSKGDEDEEDEDEAHESGPGLKPRSGKKGGKPSSKKKDKSNPRGGGGGGTPEHDSEGEEDERDDSDSDDDENGEGGEEAEFLLYFDPKTNSIGRINRREAVARSNILTAREEMDNDKKASNEPPPQTYQNVIHDPHEKQQIILLLKKLERQKPKEASWLDQIKQEKEAALSPKTRKLKADQSKLKKHKSTARISKRNLMGGKKKAATSSSKKPLSPVKASPGRRKVSLGKGGNFHNALSPEHEKASVETMKITKLPLDDGDEPTKPTSTRNSKPRKKKSTVENYQAVYKMGAEKPDASGWGKVKTSKRALQ